MKISIIIPVLNEPDLLQEQLFRLQATRSAGHEVIVVDGGSQGAVAASVLELADWFLVAPPGRSLQMNEGARLATGDVLLFLHVDTWLPDDACDLISQGLESRDKVWGRFDVRLSGSKPIFRIIERAINTRSHLTGIATGDQGLFVRSAEFERLDGFAPIPLMEDVEICKRLRRHSWPVRIHQPAVTSSRRWEQQGIVRTVLLMWWLRLRYFLGASPHNLAGKYYA